MTEAQKTLYYIAENMRMDKSISKEGYEHFQQAIKALEQEPTTKNDLGVDCNNCKNNFHRGDGTSYCATGDGMCHYECEETTKNDLGVDCISKSDALDSINWAYNLSDAYEKINMLPSVLPKADKPKEKWIHKNVEMSILKIECPICGFHRNVINETLAKFNYCPNCGADMREVEE